MPSMVQCFRCRNLFSSAIPRAQILICEQWDQQLSVLPPCNYIVCKDCFGSCSTVFPTAHDDGQGLHMLPPHFAYGGWDCPCCVVRVNLDRDVSTDDPVTLHVLDLEVQRQLDVAHSKAPSTLKGYAFATSAMEAFGKKIGASILPAISHKPPTPSSSIRLSWYVLDAMLRGGRLLKGRSLGTVESHRSAFSDFMTRYVEPAPTSAAETILLSSFFTGLARRVQRNVRPALALKVTTVVAVLRLLEARIPKNPHLLVYGCPEFAETYTRLGFGSVFALSFLCFLRGNEAYQLNLAQVQGDLVTMDTARVRRCTPHFVGVFSVTKTMRDHAVRIACVLLSQAGIDLGSFLIPFLVLRQRLPLLSSPRLFVQHSGALFNSRFFLHVFLRPALHEVQTSGAHGGELHGVEIDVRITTNSLRRGGNTAAANAGVRRELRMGHARWKAPMGQMVDHYDEVGLERQLSVSYLLSDEAPFNGYDWT